MTALQQNLKLLVIEDNPGDLVLIEEYLAEILATVDIKHAKTFGKAKTILQQVSNFSAILMDLTLPDLSGESLVEKIVALAGRVPVIVLTRYENQEFGLKTLNMGVVDYVLKDELTPFMLGKVITYGIERNRVRQSLQKSEKKYRDIFNLSPQPMYLVDMVDRKIVDVNKAAIDQYGYSREEFVGLNLMDIRPKDQVYKLNKEIEQAENSKQTFYKTVLEHQKKSGERFFADISTSRLKQDGKVYRMVLAEDITLKLEAEQNAKQKSDLLAANAKVTGALIKNENWLEALSETFDVVGKAVEVDWVYYFETHYDKEQGKDLLSQRIEWSADTIKPQIDNPDLQDIEYAAFPDIMDPLLNDKVFQAVVPELPESELKELLKSQGIISILTIPIFIDARFYGFIGFDDCQKERKWDKEEIQYLKTLTSNVSSAIKLRNTNDELKVSEYKFKSMVEEGGDLIEILDKEGNFKFISPNLPNILGWSLDELNGKNAFDFIHPNDVNKAKEDFAKIMRSKHAGPRPFRFQNKNGTWDWLKSSATNLLDDDIINGILVTASDVTEQKYYNELQKLERDVLEKNALREYSSKEITYDFLSGIEKLHSAVKTSVTLVKDGKLFNFSSPSLPKELLESLEGVEIGEKVGSCGTAAYRKEQVISSNIFEDPLWEDYKWLGGKFNFSACWSEPIINSEGKVIATFAIYYESPSTPTEYEQNTVERAAQIIRILFESEEKKQAEKQLAHSKKRFKALVQEGSDLIGILDKDLRFKYVSPSIGGAFEEYVGMKALDLVHPDDYDRIEYSLNRLKDEKRVVLESYRLRDFSGNYYWVETIITNLLDEPAVNGYVANSRNVTQQIEREEKLRELSLVAAKTTDAVIITDSDGLITWVNNGFKELTGYKLTEIIGKIPGAFLQGPDTNPQTVQNISVAIENNESIETTILNYSKDGTPYWLNMSIDPIFTDAGECSHFIAIERDVTEKIEKEKELQESLERYNIVNKATSDTIWDLDIKTDRMVYNDNIYTMFGYHKKEVENVGNWWRDKIHPEDLSKVDQELSNVQEENKDRFQLEYRFKAADGTYKYILDRAFVIKDDEGNSIRMIGAMQDITQKREEEERLKLLESVITNTSESVVILDAEPGQFGREIVFVNEAFTELTGYSREEVLGKTLHFLNGPETADQVRKHLRTEMDNYEATEVEFINYKKNGEKFWINTSMVPVQDNEGNYTHWVAIGRDITERKRNEKAIKASLTEKETLLAEIHHRVKNNLAVVSGMMQLQAFESENEDLKAKLYDSVVRIKTMASVHELLYQSNSFSELEFSETLRKLVKNVSETLQPKEEILLDIHCDPLTLNINQAIPASLIVNEVITNAYKHAFKNMNKGSIKFSLTEQDNNIKINIKDNGVGFDVTNPLKSGSLGMHLITALTDQIQGTCEYKSEGGGANFTLTFKKMKAKKGIGNTLFS
ncbi:PAS domain S-box protein [Gracilimonas sp.]|uniref:PAS domain S-box protein n=1 Tax=Gracilimonas sp. TaxID=1974203 RepID=UPI002872566A|nr:PAS domain S-box protein [Gracilimonas sp.]